jgi:pimeloyl-ACP methyl ester carboxylesterase
MNLFNKDKKTSEVGLLSIINSSQAVVDIIFVHGLGANRRMTWHHQNKSDSDYDENNFWPRWLGEDLANQGIAANIWLFGYDSKKFRYEAGNTAERLDQAKLFLSYLAVENLTQRPIFMIAHSMGGLVVKEMLGVAEHEYPQIFKQIRGIVFLATPHQGANITSLVNGLGLGSLSMRELQPDNADLRRLNEQYVRQARCQNWGTLPFYEMYPTGGTILVDQNSADPKVPNQESYNPVPKDHINIAKCNSKDELVYRQIFQFVKKFTNLSIPLTTVSMELTPEQRESLSMELTPEQRESFRQAILSAYLTEDDLNIALDLLQGIQLNQVAKSDKYPNMVQSLILKFNSGSVEERSIEDLIRVLYNHRKGNPKMASFYNSLGWDS